MCSLLRWFPKPGYSALGGLLFCTPLRLGQSQMGETPPPQVSSQADPSESQLWRWWDTEQVWKAAREKQSYLNSSGQKHSSSEECWQEREKVRNEGLEPLSGSTVSASGWNQSWRSGMKTEKGTDIEQIQAQPKVQMNWSASISTPAKQRTQSCAHCPA